MSDKIGAWQHNQTHLSERMMRVMRDPAWAKEILDWPSNETLVGYERRDLGRLKELFLGFSRKWNRSKMLPPPPWAE
jgi:hypothetical protein